MDSIPQILLRFVLRRRTRYVLAWLVAVSAAGITLFCSWHAFDPPVHPDGTPKRPGGNNGHTTIDFGGQWLMGRVLAKGLGQHLYHRSYQREVLREAYPQEEETPDEDRPPEEKGQHDVDNLMSWLVRLDDRTAATATASFLAPLAVQDPLNAAVMACAGQDELETRLAAAATPQISGPLYPPIHALVMYPLGQLRPAHAYRIVQVLSVLLAFLAGWAVRLLSEGRIWWPVAVTLVILYPAFASSVNLGQNSIIMLALLMWGWTCIARRQPIWGGILWGMLAFKPVWAMAFFLVPLLTGRWRVCLAMLATGTVLAVATLPLVGWESWLNWLRIGREATLIYHTDENWVFISRDLLNLPRRWLLDFQIPYTKRDNLAATLVGWSIFVAIIGCTVWLTLWRRDRRQALTGPPAAFLLLGAWMSCFHFMYYDLVLTALPVLLLLTEPGRYFRPILLGVLPLTKAVVESSQTEYFQPRPASKYPSTQFFPHAALRHICVLNSLTLSLLVLLAMTEFLFPLLDISVSVSLRGLAGSAVPMPLKYSTSLRGTPWNTFCLMALWLWCGWQWLRSQPQPDSRITQSPASTPSAAGTEIDAAQLV